MKFILLITFAFLICGTLPAETVEWRYEYDLALVAAPKEGKPILLYFTAPWCTYCHLMETATFADPGIHALLNDSFVSVKIDYDRNPELVGKYQIQGIPAFVLLDRFGEVVSASSGYQDAAHFTDWMKSHLAEASAELSKAQMIENRIKAFDPDLQNPDSEIRRRAISGLVDICINVNGAQEHKLAEARLKSVVEQIPGDAVPWLNDPRLAVRILFANLFAGKFGDAFVFDPWETTEVRTGIIKEWAEKLSGAPNTLPAAAQ